MLIQNIELSVPVGRDTPAVEAELKEEFASQEAELAVLAQACVQAVRKCYRRVWSSRTRKARRQQLERELKGIVKRLASGAGGVIDERHGRSEVKIRIYSDVMNVVSTLTTDLDLRLDRTRAVHKWVLVGGGCCLFVGGFVAGTMI